MKNRINIKIILLMLCVGIISFTYPFASNQENQASDPQKNISAAKQTAIYGWPLDINNGYSSDFQEYRTGHFHAGMDLRTFQKDGYPVYAITNGWVYKIRMAKRGGGRSIFFKHDDGNKSIFLHLQGFEKELEKIVEQVQKEKKKKYFGFYKLPNPIRYTRGQLIGYSGESGAGFPHLHVEIRDPKNVALNPFQLIEFPARDENFPIMKGIVFKNRETPSVNGLIGEKYFRFHKKETSNEYYIPSPVVITGNFNMMLDTYDIADTGKGVGIYRIQASIDGNPYYSVSFDTVTRNDNNQLSFVYDVSHSSLGYYYFNLFSQKRYTLEQKQVPFEQLTRSLEPGKHNVEIQVTDHFGNVSNGSVVFYKVIEPELELSGLSIEEMEEDQGYRLKMVIDRLKSDPAGMVLIEVYDSKEQQLSTGTIAYRDISEKKTFEMDGIKGEAAYVDFKFQMEGVSYHTKRYVLNTDHYEDISDIPTELYIDRDEVFIIVKDKRFCARDMVLNAIQDGKPELIYAKDSASGIYFRFKPVNALSGAPVQLRFSILKDGEPIAQVEKRVNLFYLPENSPAKYNYHEFTAEFVSHAVNESKAFLFEEMKYSTGYPVLSPQVRFTPNNFSFIDTVIFKFKKRLSNPKQVGIFRYMPGSRSWRYVNTQYDYTSAVYQVKVLTPATYALLRDRFPPGVKFLGTGTKYLKSVEHIVLRITDKGKGVNEGSINVWINGKRACQNFDWEYDPDYASFEIKDIHLLHKGKNVLRVKLRDHAGNRTQRVFKFKLK